MPSSVDGYNAPKTRSESILTKYSQPSIPSIPSINLMCLLYQMFIPPWVPPWNSFYTHMAWIYLLLVYRFTPNRNNLFSLDLWAAKLIILHTWKENNQNIQTLAPIIHQNPFNSIRNLYLTGLGPHDYKKKKEISISSLHIFISFFSVLWMSINPKNSSYLSWVIVVYKQQRRCHRASLVVLSQTRSLKQVGHLTNSQ
jgi:hypothetical protein